MIRPHFNYMLENSSENTRLAVGALIYSGKEILLVRKVKAMDMCSGPVAIDPEWDFVKGGVEWADGDIEVSLFRELYEELGTSNFRIVRKLPNLNFDFPGRVAVKLGKKRQRTLMFLVEFLGQKNDLRLNDGELDKVEFLSKDDALLRLTHRESRSFVASNFSF